MSGKDYVINYSAMDQLYLLVCSRINGWYNELSGWSEEYTRLVDMESFQGKSAESAKAYLQEVHGLILCFMQQTLQFYQVRYLLYKNGYYDIDRNIYANLPQEALQNVRKKLRNESEKLQNISDSIRRSVNSVSDLIYLKNPSIYNLKETMDGLKQELQEFDQKIESYETSELIAAQGELHGLIDSLQTTIQGYLSNGTNIASYQPGSVAGNTKILDLYQRAAACNEYVQEHKEEIELAAAEQEDTFARMQEDYEAACEAREAEGQAKLIQGGVAIVLGTIAIVGSAGMATPIVIAAGVSGGSAIVYGASTSVEGAQDWYLGSIGDLETAAVNPIRDTVFAGNQELYDLWGNLSMTVAGMCIPVGQAVNGVAGMGKDVLVKTAIKTIAKETVQDGITDKISSEVTEFATDRLKLNKAWSTALNVGISLGLDKGMDFAGQKIGVSNGPRFTDKMSFDEAARYNGYWDNVELKVQGNGHPADSMGDVPGRPLEGDGIVYENVGDLSDTQIDALKKYTGDDYRNINNSLRGMEEAAPENRVTIKEIKSALDHAALPEDMTLYRGTSTDALGDLKNLQPEDMVGQTFTEQGFMSTSTNSAVAGETFKGNMQITIEVSKGAHAMDISSISKYKSEGEILFNAGQELLITSAEYKDGILYITALAE